MIDDLPITLRNGTACCTMDKITVRQAKRYAEIMEQTGSTVQAMLRSATTMLPELFGCLRPADVIRAKATEVLTVLKALHFVMQEIVLPGFQVLQEEPVVAREDSIFDDYDEENGYNDQEEESVWAVCRENIEAITQAAIRLLRQSYTDTMNEELLPLLNHLRWELDHQPEKEEG